MRPRVAVGRALVAAGRFVQSLAVAVMRPKDLVEFTRLTYARASTVEGWARDDFIDAGLTADERGLVERLPAKAGRVLVLGVGGGREAIALAKLGYEVTGVDFVAAMVDQARENARRRGVEIAGLVQDFSRLDVPAGSFDAVWLTSGSYSSIPSRKARARMRDRVRAALRPGGMFLFEVIFDPGRPSSRRGERLRKAAALLTLGNTSYEPGDTLASGIEFIHVFGSEAEVRREVEGDGFEIAGFAAPLGRGRAQVALRKR